MTHWKCPRCHHEWDGQQDSCDWCNAPGESLGEDAQWQHFWIQTPALPVEYADMTDAQKRIVDAGNEPPAGVFPTGLNRDELIAWMTERFGL